MFQFYLVSIVFRFSLCPFNYGFSIWLCYMAPSLKDFPCNICLCHISTDAKTCDVCKPLCHRHSQKRTFWALTFFRSKCSLDLSYLHHALGISRSRAIHTKRNGHRFWLTTQSKYFTAQNNQHYSEWPLQKQSILCIRNDLSKTLFEMHQLQKLVVVSLPSMR